MNLKFKIFEKVTVSDGEIGGEVIQIRIDGNNTYYKIEYWFNGEIKNVELYEHQINRA